MINILKLHHQLYPMMEIQDMIKVIYQNEFGGGHMIDDYQKSYQRLKQECQSLPEGELRSEKIGNGFVRVYLKNIDDIELETLHQLFVVSSSLHQGSLENFLDKLDVLYQCPWIEKDDLDKQLQYYQQLNYPPISHSDNYRHHYHPHYRVIKESIFQYYSVILKINQDMRDKEHYILAIDGQCASGKSTLARILKEIYQANLFCLDDFFLQPFQRTEQRLQEPGGNVDYERFKSTVINPLLHHQDVHYQCFDCSKMALNQDITIIPYNRVNIIEGSYALHPYFGHYYHYALGMSIDTSLQEKRILQRNGPLMLERFKQLWIPLENNYFDTYHIFDRVNDQINHTNS